MRLKERLRALNKSKNARTLVGNFASLSLLQVANYILPLITLPYLARTIGVDKFGAIAFGTSVIVYFHTLVDYGFHYTAVRDISKNRDNADYVSKLFSSVIVIRCILMLLSFIALVVLIQTIPLFYENRVILYLTFLYLPGHVIFPDWYFQAIEKMKYITLMNLLSKLIFTVMVFIVIKEKDDYIYQPILTATGFFVSGVLSMTLILTRFNIKFKIPSFKDLLQTFKGGGNVFLSVLFPSLYNNFSVILLRSYGGEVPTGIFASGNKFIDLGNRFSRVLSRTFFPFLARRMDKHTLYRNIAGTASILMSAGLFFGAELLVKLLLTEEFIDAVKVIRIMSISPIFLFLMNTYGTNYLVLKHRDRAYRNIVTIGSIIGFAMTWVMVTRYSFIGAAISITCTRFMIGLTTFIVARRIK